MLRTHHAIITKNRRVLSIPCLVQQTKPCQVAFRIQATLKSGHGLQVSKRKRLFSVQASGGANQKGSRTISSTSQAGKAAQAIRLSPSAAASSLSTATAEIKYNTSSSSVKNLLEMVKMSSSTRAAILPIIGNASYIALASGFLMTDMLELRLLLIGGYSGIVTFHSLHERPLRIPLRWSALFVAVNALGAAWLLMDRYAPASLDSAQHPDGEDLYRHHFRDILTRGQFHQLLGLAQRQSIPAGTVLTRENTPCGVMYFIVQGQATVHHGEGLPQEQPQSSDAPLSSTATAPASSSKVVATIDEGGFVNDVAFSQGPNVGAYATIITSRDSQVLVWDTNALRRHMQSRPDLERNMKYCMSDHLVKSLLRQRDAAHKRHQQQSEQQVAQF